MEGKKVQGVIPKSKREIEFLKGPHSRWKEFRFLVDVFFDLLKGLRTLHFSGPCVTIFGSARFDEKNEYYQITEEIASRIARLGFTVMTGGGPGIMEAANKGAKSVNGRSVGCNIILPFEQKVNPYLDRYVNMEYFFTRKTLLIKYSYAFIIMPGGYGTMDEFFETMTLIQTGEIEHFPMIIFGKAYHKDLIEFIEEMKRNKTISEKDDELILVTDDIDEVEKHIQKNLVIKKELMPYNLIKPIPWLFEK